MPDGVLSIPRPLDMHQHLRDGELMRAMVPLLWPYEAVLVMPNLNPPVDSWERLIHYHGALSTVQDLPPSPSTKEQMIEYLGSKVKFLMTLYLTPTLTAEEIYLASHGDLTGIKGYPYGKTTNAQFGIKSYREVDKKIFEMMVRRDIVLNVHGEHPDEPDELKREEAFLEEFEWLAGSYPDLRIVLEHVTTAKAVELVKKLNANVAATVTAHHLYLTHDQVYDPFHPHHKCMPIAKQEADRVALLEAICSSTKFFFGSDAAPHLKRLKEKSLVPGECPSGVYYPGEVAIPLVAKALSLNNELRYLTPFTSIRAARFYYYQHSGRRIDVVNEPWVVPETFGSEEDDTVVVPFMAGQTLEWRVRRETH